MEWVNDYLKILMIPKKQASTPYLKRLLSAHRQAFPFENIGKLVFCDQFDVTEDVESFLWRHRRYQTGGTCVALNLQFSRLLKALGFQVFFLQPGGDHMALLVSAPESGQPLYVDIGTPIPLLTPLPLNKRKQTQVPLFAGEKVILMAGEVEGEYTYIRTIADRIVDRKWAFSINERYDLHDFHDLIRDSYQPDAQYMTQLRCDKWYAKRRRMLSLKNKELTIRTHTGGKIKRNMKSPNDVLDVMVNVFALPKLPVKKAMDRLEARGYLLWDEDHHMSSF